jgi:hypothetical protein
VVLRVSRGDPAPDESAIRTALAADRARLALTPYADLDYRLAGPYAVLIGGETLDEYVAWEV